MRNANNKKEARAVGCDSPFGSRFYDKETPINHRETAETLLRELANENYTNMVKVIAAQTHANLANIDTVDAMVERERKHADEKRALH